MPKSTRILDKWNQIIKRLDGDMIHKDVTHVRAKGSIRTGRVVLRKVGRHVVKSFRVQEITANSGTWEELA